MSCQSIWDRHRYVVTVRNALGCIIYNTKLQRKVILSLFCIEMRVFLQEN